MCSCTNKAGIRKLACTHVQHARVFVNANNNKHSYLPIDTGKYYLHFHTLRQTQDRACCTTATACCASTVERVCPGVFRVRYTHADEKNSPSRDLERKKTASKRHKAALRGQKTDNTSTDFCGGRSTPRRQKSVKMSFLFSIKPKGTEYAGPHPQAAYRSVKSVSWVTTRHVCAISSAA